MRIEPLRRPRRALRLASLVDIVFLLLVFFMLVSRLDVPQTLIVEVPSEASAGTLQGAVLVRLGNDGSLDVNGRPIGIERLAGAILPFLAKDPDVRVLVQSAREAPLEKLVRVLDRLRGAGAQDLRLLEP